MAQPELIIFDCDGVLVDSEIIAARVEAELLSRAGYPIQPEELAEIYAGLTFKQIMLRIEKEAAIPLQASLIDEAEALIDERLAREVQPIEGAHETIAATTAPYCICSNSSSERLAISLERTRLMRFFKGRIFSALEIPSHQPKPAPDVFLFAAERLGARPADTIVLEDSVHGVAGARAAGMRVIGFTGASHSHSGHADALTEAGAETVIRRWRDFPATVAALAAWSPD